MFAPFIKKAIPLILAAGLLLAGCQDVAPQSPLLASSNSSSVPSSNSSARPKGIFFAATPPNNPLQLDTPSEYDLLVAAESAVRADIDATPILSIPLNDLTTLYLSYSFENASVMVSAHPDDPERLLFYYRDTENSVTWLYQYSLRTSDFILLAELGFSAVSEQSEPFWAGNVFCHLSDITSSDEQINLSRALCCFNTSTNKWSFYPMTARERAVPLSSGNILIVSPRLDGSWELLSLDPATMETTSLFSPAGKRAPTSFLYLCPDDTVVLTAASPDGTIYSRYSLDGTLLAECPAGPQLPSEELIAYQLYRSVPLARSQDEASHITSFMLDEKDYVMPWRPAYRGNAYPTIYAKQELRSWNGLDLISRYQGWSLWQPLYSVKDTPDFLLWQEETDFWQYVNLDTASVDFTILRTIPISQNRILLQTRQANDVVLWKLLELADFYAAPEQGQ